MMTSVPDGNPLSVRREYVVDQYSDAEKLRVRIETHRRYSQGTEDMLDALALEPGLSLVDVGCGSGKWHAALAGRGVAVVAVDLMAGMIEAARRAGTQLQPRPLLVRADAQVLPFRSAAFDRVLCSGVLYHVPDCRWRCSRCGVCCAPAAEPSSRPTAWMPWPAWASSTPRRLVSWATRR